VASRAGWTTGGRKDLLTYHGKNLFAYDGYEVRTGYACYYEYNDFEDGPRDSAFFQFGINTAVGIDSLGRVYLVGSKWGEYNLYITAKDLVSSVHRSGALHSMLTNSINTFVTSNTSSVRISLRLRHKLEGALKVYDILGREILIVRRGSFLEGESELTFESKNLSSGIYFVVLESKSARLLSKFVLVR
jgi:hypothetical protein